MVLGFNQSYTGGVGLSLGVDHGCLVFLPLVTVLLYMASLLAVPTLDSGGLVIPVAGGFGVPDVSPRGPFWEGPLSIAAGTALMACTSSSSNSGVEAPSSMAATRTSLAALLSY
jgi:hypothetical protein